MIDAWWLALPTAIALGLLVVLWSVRRHTSPSLTLSCEQPIERLMPSLAGLTLGQCTPGNSVTVLENGGFFEMLLRRISQAQHSVHFETFLWKRGELGRRLAQALAERARAGVTVRLLLDANGCRAIGDDTVHMLTAAGCRLVRFHPMKLKHLGMFNDRDHRKLAVIDGREAFVGGHCIVDEWLGNAEDEQHVADVSVQLHGPIVHSVQAAFSENWGAMTGEMFVGDAYFPPLDHAGNVPIHVAFVKPEGSASAVKILHHAAICVVRRRLWIQNPYFIPEPEAVRALGDAVRRGVDVRVLTPSTGGSDNPLVQHAGHYQYEQLLRSGVRIFEYPHTLLHQKVMVMDGTWTAIGSSNFDDRSFDTNDEITLGILDAAVADRMEAIFERYAGRARELTLEQWRKRGLWHRIKDAASYSINEVL